MVKAKNNQKTVKLTSREREVLLLICNELSPLKICRKLKIEMKTYHNHRWHLSKKIGSKSSIGLYKFALERRWV